MRRLGDALLLGAVVVVAAVVIMDAAEPSEAERKASVVSALRDAGVAGRLVVAAADCSRREVELPSLEQSALGVIACSVYGRPGALAVYRGGVVWYAFAGGTTTLLRADQLGALVGRRARVVRVAWLGNVRFVASYRAEGRRDTLAIFERDRLVRELARARRFGDVRSSPGGRYFAVRADGRVRLYDVRGEPVALPGAAERARALAWSPDDRWAVAVGPRDLTVFETASRRVVAAIPGGGVDVDWTAVRAAA
jgi:hypothetical protein